METNMLTTSFSLILFCTNAIPQGIDNLMQFQATTQHGPTSTSVAAPCDLELRSDVARTAVYVRSIELPYPCSTELALNTGLGASRLRDPLLRAAGHHNYYMAINLGMSSLSDSDISDIGNSADVSFDSGLSFDASLGYHWSKNVRVEAALGYRKGDVDQVAFNGASQDGPGDMNIMTFMANAYYDVDLGSKVQPYLGLGLGLGTVELNTNAIENGENFSVDGSGVTLLFNFSAGISYAINDRINIDLGYRYLSGIDASLETSFTGGFIGVSGDTNVPFAASEICIGMRYSF
jgi:opacity protein-like surface antigen